MTWDFSNFFKIGHLITITLGMDELGNGRMVAIYIDTRDDPYFIFVIFFIVKKWKFLNFLHQITMNVVVASSHGWFSMVGLLPYFLKIGRTGSQKGKKRDIFHIFSYTEKVEPSHAKSGVFNFKYIGRMVVKIENFEIFC